VERQNKVVLLLVAKELDEIFRMR